MSSRTGLPRSRSAPSLPQPGTAAALLIRFRDRIGLARGPCLRKRAGSVRRLGDACRAGNRPECRAGCLRPAQTQHGQSGVPGLGHRGGCRTRPRGSNGPLRSERTGFAGSPRTPWSAVPAVVASSGATVGPRTAGTEERLRAERGGPNRSAPGARRRVRRSPSGVGDPPCSGK
jgi:hypothetical protein